MVTLQSKPQSVDASQDLDELSLPKPTPSNPFWKIVKSTAKRVHESWETTLDEGMKNHQAAINGVVKGAQNFVDQSVQTVVAETESGINLVRQSLGLKAANDELERELKLNESVFGGSPAIASEQRVTLNKLARAEQKAIQADGNERLEDVLSQNEDLANDRQGIQAELKALGDESIDAVTKLRMDVRAVRSQIEQLNRTGQPVDVAKVFDSARKEEVRTGGDRSKIVSLLVGQSGQGNNGVIEANGTPVQPTETSVSSSELKPELKIVEPQNAPEQDYSDIRTTLQDFSKTRLRKIATALNSKVGDENKITKVRSRDKDNLLEILGTPERLSLLAQNYDLIEANMTATAATRIKGDAVTTSTTGE